MNWNDEIRDFSEYLSLERGLTPDSVRAYTTDVQKLVEFLSQDGEPIPPQKLTAEQFHNFVIWLGQKGVSPRTQARILSGIRSFFKNLLLSEKLEEDPTQTVQAPKIGRKLPTVLSVEEIDLLESTIDLNKPEGMRNLALVETLYSCGLRVSELTDLKLSELFFDKGYVKVYGKGRKERLVSIGPKAQSYITEYINGWRTEIPIVYKNEDYVFLNRRGTKLSRIMVFNIIKEAAKFAGINKDVSPHTLRHSFATHLVDGGANLRAVQQMLGHESIMTTEIYTHLDNTYLRTTLSDHHPYKDDKEENAE